MKEFITDFVEKFKKNCERGWELDQTLMEEVSFGEWKKLLVLRSNEIRRIYQENEQLLGELSEFLHHELNEESAQLLYDNLASLYYGAYDDLFIMRIMAEPLMRFYEARDDYEKLVFLYHLMAFENFEFYDRMLGENEISRSIEYYRKVIALKDHYAEICDPKNRKCIITAYSNLIAPVGQVSDEIRKQLFDIYDEVMELWNSDTVQRLDGDNEEIKEHIAQVQDDLLIMEERTSKMTAEQKQRFVAAVEKIGEDYRREGREDKSGNLRRARLKCRLLAGEDIHVLIREFVDYLKELPLPDFEADETDTVRRILDFHNTSTSAFDIFRMAEMPEEEKERYLREFYDKVTGVHIHIPFGFWTNMINDLCAEWFREVSPFLGDPKESRDLLLKLVISRQPVTYIHCLMVSEISTRITASMIKYDPGFFVGILGCGDAAEVQERRDEIVGYVADCAMLHDVGKCEIVEIINRQNRRLSDAEFEMIRRHPEKGPELLNYNSVFAPYYDVMLGHHRTYDGKGGYPMSFDNTASDVKPVIDIITIADCTDAATDILGRNYTEGKDFEHLFRELCDGAGTRYSPGIVELLKKDRGLYKDLVFLTGEGRQSIYYRAYREIVFL